MTMVTSLAVSSHTTKAQMLPNITHLLSRRTNRHSIGA